MQGNFIFSQNVDDKLTIYEYKTLTESYAPQKNSVHYKVTTSSYSAIKVPKGMTVYTPTGVYKAQ
jgi:predicted DNA binding CopG/RHH family protein